MHRECCGSSEPEALFDFLFGEARGTRISAQVPARRSQVPSMRAEIPVAHTMAKPNAERTCPVHTGSFPIGACILRLSPRTA